jgi:Xaa-Pro aminopeptidase
MRSVKSPREIALIRRASQLAGLGILEAIKSTRAGLDEYQLDAAARYIFLSGGARLEGYRSITAAGTANIWNGHYYRNIAQLKDGDLVLMDFAPDYGYYTSDVTRMWPIIGKYSPVQRELLQFVLEYRNAVLKLIRPGITTKSMSMSSQSFSRSEIAF